VNITVDLLAPSSHMFSYTQIYPPCLVYKAKEADYNVGSHVPETWYAFIIILYVNYESCIG